MDLTPEETGEEIIHRHVLKPEVDPQDFEKFRSYWLYRVKLAVLTDRWGEAIVLALQAVRAPPAPIPQCPPEVLYKHSHPPKPMREWRVLTRAIEGRLKQIRERMHKTEALLWGDRSMETKEAFGEQAREMLLRFKSKLDQTCEDSLKILNEIIAPDVEGQMVIARLRGDIHRYMQKLEVAETEYKTGLKAAAGAIGYDASCCHMGMHALGQKVDANPPSGGGHKEVTAQLPYLPIQLSRVYGGQADARVQLGFEDDELRAAPLNAI